ncbi:MAG: ATP-dependent metallopeptidase FtsH/Yme1/Tma family protein, partial [Devosia sp.]
MEKRRQYNLWYLAGALVLFGAFQFWISYRSVTSITYSEMLTYLEQGKISEVSITESQIEGRFKTTEDGFDYFVAHRVDPELVDTFIAAGVEVQGASDSNWLTTILSWIVPMLVLGGFWFFVFRGMAERGGIGGLTAIGKSKAKIYVETQTGVTFA